MQGSNDGTNWATMHDLSGAEVVATSNTLAVLAENPLYIRPLHDGAGTGTVTINIVGRKS